MQWFSHSFSLLSICNINFYENREAFTVFFEISNIRGLCRESGVLCCIAKAEEIDAKLIPDGVTLSE